MSFLCCHNIQTILVFTVIAAFLKPIYGKDEISCASKKVNSLCVPRNYSKFDLPDKENTNRVGVSIDIDDVLRIDDSTYTITFATYFNIEWNEKRFKLKPDFGSSYKRKGSTEPVMVPVDIDINDLWIPNLFIYNLESFHVMSVLSKLDGVWVDTDKNVLFSQAARITFSCPMRFDRFPMDTHRCKFMVGSYSYNSKKLLFITKTFGYSSKERNSHALDYDLMIKPLQPEDALLNYGALGNFSVAGFEIVLTRYASMYILTYYIPFGLFVIMSWISFLISPDKVSGRMTLLVLIFLVMVNIFKNGTTNLPKAEVLTALEVWMLFCTVFVFATIAEYTFILYKKQYLVREEEESEKLVKKETFYRLDKIFLMGMPILFLTFNVIYWSVALF